MSNESNTFGNETDLLQKVLRKLEKLSEITVKNGVDETLAEMGEADRAVLMDYASSKVAALNDNSQEPKPKKARSASGEDTLAESIEDMLSEAGLGWSQLEQWNFDVL